jgi:hypothetical protein
MGGLGRRQLLLAGRGRRRVDPHHVGFRGPDVGFFDSFVGWVDPFVGFVDPFVGFVDPLDAVPVVGFGGTCRLLKDVQRGGGGEVLFELARVGNLRRRSTEKKVLRPPTEQKILGSNPTGV